MASMRLEEIRYLHEDIERLEQAISDRLAEKTRHESQADIPLDHPLANILKVREKRTQEQEISHFIQLVQDQSAKLLHLETDEEEIKVLAEEERRIGTGDSFNEFYKLYDEIKDYHQRNPNEPVENLEKAYKKRSDHWETYVDQLFSGEESYGTFLDLVSNHEQYLNLPGIRGGRRLTYLQYVDNVDRFSLKRDDKLKHEYWLYCRDLADYLQEFLKKTRPLEDNYSRIKEWSDEFTKKWEANEISGWEVEFQPTEEKPDTPTADGEDGSMHCTVCKRGFTNENVFKAHFTSKKHIKNVKGKESTSGTSGSTDKDAMGATEIQRLKERAVAECEYRVQIMLSTVLQKARNDTRTNIQRRMVMTDKERQQERDALSAQLAEGLDPEQDEVSDNDDEDRVYNPLKLPLAWDGKPIPFWLYRLHGLGVEFSCQICGNYVYMGRRNFERHFNEARHTYGLRALGIKNTTLFREITEIQEAVNLNEKLQQDESKVKAGDQNVEQMEDSQGNVMPKKVYYDLQKQGLV